ncbi:histidine utilization repressor [Vibrio sp.]|uniref:Histidine utilization repressor n=1 Tax=Vibrio viridaestus TaxID=2487322 RepID=A0A3N9U5S6_9VIBR|nr:histidine utilization repressor [Vibrio viridaestus]MDC0609699.1 histidine utilization repressor [Vibrio sp.]RQW63406.1 histidine utilization repressor [Vibrio viridaestus]
MSESPLYLQIKRYIEDNIDRGFWPVGHRITTELELAKQFSVSRMTVNKAIRDLVNNGKLQRRPRLGTFVSSPQQKAESPLLDIRNIADEIHNRGQEYRSDVKIQKSIIADDDIATKLGVMLGSQTYYTEIIHYADNIPLQLEVRWVNAQFAPDYINQDFTQITPNHYLSIACPLSAIEHTVEAITPDSKVKSALLLTNQEPCLLLNRRTWSEEKLISSALLYHPASKYKLSSKVTLT